MHSVLRASLAATLWLALGVVAARPLLAESERDPDAKGGGRSTATILNDVHSRLNATKVAEVITPATVEEVAAVIRRAKAEGKAISISGARHSMGTQQFAEGSLHLDMRKLNRFLALDAERGLARVEAGITWPALRAALDAAQQASSTGDDANAKAPWSVVQKQTGADELTLGGAVSSNIHGRGLNWQPFVQDIESVTMLDAEARTLKLSRTENAELFSLVVGGYGLFGVITEVELRLRRRERVERVVEIGTLQDLPDRIQQRLSDGFLLGDFQFCPDEKSPGFLKEGVFSCYRPVDKNGALPVGQKSLNPEAWRKLLTKAHVNKAEAWTDYKTYYQRTNGQLYDSDAAQFNHYDPDYVERLKEAIPGLPDGSLMISEVYVPRVKLEDFMAASADDFRQQSTNVIYGTIRFIRKDDVTFLPWAKEDYACIVFNLRVTHTPEGIDKARGEFQRLIQRALDRGGSFFLTYHRWATREQMLTAYPQFPEFLKLKLQYDPTERFQSEWYRYWKKEMAGK